MSLFDKFESKKDGIEDTIEFTIRMAITTLAMLPISVQSSPVRDSAEYAGTSPNICSSSVRTMLVRLTKQSTASAKSKISRPLLRLARA